jgi:hypothetical protein
MVEILVDPASRSRLAQALRHWDPRTPLGKLIREATAFLPAELAAELIDTVRRSVVIESELSGVLYRPGRRPEYLGVLSRKVITDVGVGFIVDAWQGTVEPEIMRFHAYGTGGAAEAVGNTALATELTTQYAVDNTRPTGSLAENAANVFETVATLSPDSGGTIAITEHGVFSQAATGGGVLFDRSLFSVINVVAAADSLQTTYRATFTSGG